MTTAYKRLFSGYGKIGVPTPLYTVPNNTATVLKEIQVTNTGANLGSLGVNNAIFDLAIDPNGNIFFTDYTLHVICKITPEGKKTIFAGMVNITGTTDGVGTAARFNAPRGICVDSTGTYLYVCDYSNARVRRITIADGTVLTIAGNGTNTQVDNATGTAGTIYLPQFCSISSDDSTVYISVDATQGNIRAVSTTGTFALSTVTLAAYGSASLYGIAVDAAKTWIYAVRNTPVPGANQADIVRFRISDGQFVVIAGSNANGSGLGDGVTTNATFNAGRGVCLDETDPLNPRVYVCDYNNSAIRLVDFTMSGPLVLAFSQTNTVVGIPSGNSAFAATSKTAASGRANGISTVSKIVSPMGCKFKNNAVYFTSAVGQLWRYGTADGFCHVIAGYNTATSSQGMCTQGAALPFDPGYFNIYVVPSGETLDLAKHCRFRTQAVGPGSTVLISLNKSLNAGDKVYFEACSPHLVCELSGLEVS